MRSAEERATMKQEALARIEERFDEIARVYELDTGIIRWETIAGHVQAVVEEYGDRMIDLIDAIVGNQTLLLQAMFSGIPPSIYVQQTVMHSGMALVHEALVRAGLHNCTVTLDGAITDAYEQIQQATNPFAPSEPATPRSIFERHGAVSLENLPPLPENPTLN